METSYPKPPRSICVGYGSLGLVVPVLAMSREGKALKTSAHITNLGTQFHLTVGEEKERLSIELMRCFHPYLMKYLDMIVRGHLPRYGPKINVDSKKLLQYLLPKGTPVNKATLMAACKHLHLAFKGYEPEEIYSVLASVLIRVISKYDPFYVDKVKKTVETICRPLSRHKEVTVHLIQQHVDFDPRFIVRMLVKKGYLEQVSAVPKKQTYRRVAGNWPPPAILFEQGPIGLPYYVAGWFRYYFKQYVCDQMTNLESKEDIVQLEHRSRIQSGWE